MIAQNQIYSGHEMSRDCMKWMTGIKGVAWSNAGKNVLLHVTLPGMNALKIFAADVGNLSDARYFAALGVDFLSFDLSPYSEDKWQKAMAMTEWIEGPKMVFPYSLMDNIHGVEDYALLFDTPEKKPPFLISDVFFRLPLNSLSEDLFANGLSEGNLLITGNMEDLEQKRAILEIFCRRMPVYLDLNSRTETLSDLIHELQPEGIVVRGGQEEKPGFKSFEELDAWFDEIASFR
jgi:phosphoribosylanthranilate isomerase